MLMSNTHIFVLSMSRVHVSGDLSHHLPEKLFLNDVGPHVSSCDFEPCGGYP
jgi:hypothetical protein